MRIKETSAKSLLVASKLPDADYVINPYTGCSFGCSYCYATFMGKYAGESIESWGEWVYVKTNAVDLAQVEVPRLARRHPDATLLLSSVTDPYQGVESKYRLTRGILNVLRLASWRGRVGILTKSPLVVRDADLLAQLPNCEVGLTVTSTDDRVSKWLEVRAPKAQARIGALRELSSRGIPVYAFVGPLLPHFRQAPGELDTLFSQLAAAGVSEVYVENINLKPYIRERLEPRLRQEGEDVLRCYDEAQRAEVRAELGVLVGQLLARHGLSLRLGEVLHHSTGKAAEAVHKVTDEVQSTSGGAACGPKSDSLQEGIQ